MHQRTAAEYQIDGIGLDRRGETAMQRLALRPQFEHVAEDGNAPALRPDRRLAEQSERGIDGDRIGVVALVNEERRTARQIELDRRTTAGDGLELGKRQRR